MSVGREEGGARLGALVGTLNPFAQEVGVDPVCEGDGGHRRAGLCAARHDPGLLFKAAALIAASPLNAVLSELRTLSLLHGVHLSNGGHLLNSHELKQDGADRTITFMRTFQAK